MAVLGNKPPVTQNAAMNATNMMNMKPGWYVPGTAPQGMLLNTPRNMNMAGGPQYYDPKYATMRQTPQVNQQLNGLQSSMARGYNGVKPGGGQSTSTGGGTGAPIGQPQTGGSYGGGQLGQISTSIQPQAIYDPWMTDVAVNQAVANADQRSNLSTLMGGFDTPGVSRSSRHAALAAPQMAQQQLTAADAKARIPFEDLMANQRNLFLGQVARENEGLGLGNLSARIYEAKNQDALSRMNQSLGYLQSLIG